MRLLLAMAEEAGVQIYDDEEPFGILSPYEILKAVSDARGLAGDYQVRS